jgi:salicylate hydroxylase
MTMSEPSSGPAIASPGSAMIVGAGLGGLTVALALLRSGWRVRVFEQAPQLGEVGAGITLSPGAGRGLASLGVEAEVLSHSLPVPDIAFVHYRTGELLAGVLREETPPDNGFETPRHIHRADLHAVLTAAVLRRDSEAIATGKRLVDLAPDRSGVTARFADGGSARADIVIGADGARSMVRKLLFDDTPPDFAGQIAFRCLIPRETAAGHMQGGNAVVSIGASRIFNRYLVRGGALVNVIGIAQCDRWVAEGWNTPATVEEFLQEYRGFHEGVLSLIRLSPPSTLIKWGLFVRPPLETWSSGRVVLVGDAAHPILPFLGLGAALAIEDAVVLGRALSLTADPRAAFAGFQNARFERVETVRTQSILQGEINQSRDPDAGGVTASPSQKTDLFGYDPCAAPLHV